MSELEREVEGVLRGEAFRLELERSRKLFTFHPYNNGDEVHIDLRGGEIAGVQIEPDHTIKGVLNDNERAILLITEASFRRELIGWRIGLVAVRDQVTPLGRHISQASMDGYVSPGAMMHYILPDLVAPGLDTERQYYPTASFYSRVVVGGTTMFDVSSSV